MQRNNLKTAKKTVKTDEGTDETNDPTDENWHTFDEVTDEKQQRKLKVRNHKVGITQ